MGAEDGANSDPAPPEVEGRHATFWKTLPGALTAAAGLVAAITGLIIGLNQTGLIGTNNSIQVNQTGDAASDSPADPAPNQPEQARPSPPASQTLAVQNSDRLFRIGEVSDGFAWVRSEPTVSDNELVQLRTGTAVTCSRRTFADTDSSANRNWRYCDAHGGYVSARLLVPVDR